MVAYAERFGNGPEIDVPAHIASWALVYPDLVIKCQKHRGFWENPKKCVYLDISNARTFLLIVVDRVRVPSSFFISEETNSTWIAGMSRANAHNYDKV